jgi:hypothetical protein
MMEIKMKKLRSHIKLPVYKGSKSKKKRCALEHLPWSRFFHYCCRRRQRTPARADPWNKNINILAMYNTVLFEFRFIRRWHTFPNLGRGTIRCTEQK